jgi:beta-galactosidase
VGKFSARCGDGLSRWQAKIVNGYKRPDQFITQDFSGGVHTNIEQWASAGNLDIVAENPYFETQKGLDGRTIWLSGDLGPLADAHELSHR